MKDTLKNSGKRECEHDLMLLALFQKVDQIDPHLRVAFAGGGLFFVFVYVGYHSRNLLSCISTYIMKDGLKKLARKKFCKSYQDEIRACCVKNARKTECCSYTIAGCRKC